MEEFDYDKIKFNIRMKDVGDIAACLQGRRCNCEKLSGKSTASGRNSGKFEWHFYVGGHRRSNPNKGESFRSVDRGVLKFISVRFFCFIIYVFVK